MAVKGSHHWSEEDEEEEPEGQAEEPEPEVGPPLLTPLSQDAGSVCWMAQCVEGPR